MISIYFLLPTLLAIFFSCLIVRAAAIALVLTGMNEDMARFQARSAFTGTGFTTKASETIINHQQRRKIVSWLMLAGNVGLVTVIITATSSFVTSSEKNLPWTIIFMCAGIYIIYKAACHEGLMYRWENFIVKKLKKLPVFQDNNIRILLYLPKGNNLIRASIRKGSSLAGKTLSESQLSEGGIRVLGIERGDEWIAIPNANETTESGDKIIVSGPLDMVKKLI